MKKENIHIRVNKEIKEDIQKTASLLNISLTQYLTLLHYNRKDLVLKISQIKEKK
ncbi:MAG: hypothetical protein VB138_01830 [Burkholderia sp.]